MSLRTQFTVYLAFIHLAFAGATGVALQSGFLKTDSVETGRLWLIAAEVFFTCSFIISLWLLRRMTEPLRLIRDGTAFLRESDFSTQLLPAGYADMDDIIGVYNSMLDALHEERLRLEEQHFFLDKLIAASPAGIVLLGFDDRISLLNPGAERLLGVRLKDAAGKSLAEVSAQLAARLESMPVGTAAVIALGGRRIRCTKSEFLERGFSRRFYMLEELTEELRRSEKAAYEKVIRLLSHEVNNSAGAVRSLLQSCLNYRDQLRLEDRDDFSNALSVAMSRTEHLSAFMKSYADVIRLPAPRLQPCDLNTMLRQMALLFQNDSVRRRVQWQWFLTERLPLIALDKLQMEQVFINLFKNALESMGDSAGDSRGEGGTLTVRTEREEGRDGLRIRVCIEDTGGGISEEAGVNLFTPFFSTKENGQGIGLTLIAEILTHHGCAFSLANRTEGGARFSIRFP